MTTSTQPQVIVRESKSRYDTFELRDVIMANTEDRLPSYWYSLSDVEHGCAFANRIVERLFHEEGRTTYVISTEPLSADQLWKIMIDEYQNEFDELEEVRIGGKSSTGTRAKDRDIMPSELCDYVDLPQGSTYREGREALEL